MHHRPSGRGQHDRAPRTERRLRISGKQKSAEQQFFHQRRGDHQRDRQQQHVSVPELRARCDRCRPPPAEPDRGRSAMRSGHRAAAGRPRSECRRSARRVSASTAPDSRRPGSRRDRAAIAITSDRHRHRHDGDDRDRERMRHQRWTSKSGHRDRRRDSAITRNAASNWIANHATTAVSPNPVVAQKPQGWQAAPDGGLTDPESLSSASRDCHVSDVLPQVSTGSGNSAHARP